jgi:hypothetical protein
VHVPALLHAAHLQVRRVTPDFPIGVVLLILLLVYWVGELRGWWDE